MKFLKLLLLTLFILFALLIGVFLLYPRGVLISVVNNGSHEIANVRIRLSQGSISWPSLRSNERHKRRVNPPGESRLHLEYDDFRGAHYVVEIDVYIEGDYSGSLDIDVRDDGKVTWEDHIRIRPWL